MITRKMSDEAVALEIGRRIDQLRLSANKSQDLIAEESGISRMTYINLTKGKAKLGTIIAVLRSLQKIELLEAFIPDEPFSPMEMLKMKKKRERASKSKSSNAKKLDNSEW